MRDDRAGDVDLPLDAADVDVDGREHAVEIVDFLDPAWDPEAHFGQSLVQPG
jgi:hypothetical protein